MQFSQNFLLIGLAFVGGPTELGVAALVGAAKSETEAAFGVNAQRGAPVDGKGANHSGASTREVVDYTPVLVDTIPNGEQASRFHNEY